MRSRNIKPGFYESEVVASVGFMERLLFSGLWCMADREGRLEDRPRRIRGEVFRYDDMDDLALDRALASLVESGLIVRYETDGLKIIWICGFTKHQHPHRNEVPSYLPEYSSEHATYATLLSLGGVACDQGQKHVAPRQDSLRLIPDSGSLIEDRGKIDSVPYRDIIDHLNSKRGASFRHQSKAARALMLARWKDGATLDDFKAVIDGQHRLWENKPDMLHYLRPSTLFALNHFDDYLAAAKAAPPKPREPVDPGPEFWAQDCLRIQQEEEQKRAEREARNAGR